MNPASAPPALRFENVEKRYGNLFALRQVNLNVFAGETIALAGRNGSGKTTLLRVAAGLVRPSRGTVTIDGQSDPRVAACQLAGFVGHQTMLYEELTAEENLRLFARLHGLNDAGSRLGTLLEDAGLLERRASLVRTFSRGMRQRLTIVRALLHRPALLLLDEPATGLDVPGIAWLAETLRGLQAAGCTMLFSVHGASEISALATRALRLEAGAIVADSQSGANVASILSLAGS